MIADDKTIWGAILALLAAAWAWIWRTIPDKRYVDNSIAAVENRFVKLVELTRHEDQIADRELFSDLVKPIAQRMDTIETQQKEAKESRDRQHQEGMRMMRRILDKLEGRNAI